MDWGMKNRLARIIKPEDGRAVMLAVDYGYFLGPTSGVGGTRQTLETVPSYADSPMLTRGVLWTSVGAHFVKTYYCEDFDKVVESCPIPVIIAGGKKTPEIEALELAFNVVQRGAVGVDMGRNIFQSDSPVGMIRAVRAIVHDKVSVAEARKIYESSKGIKTKRAAG